MENERKLNWFEVAIALVSIHYGLGFLLGSGDAIYTRGSLGILYAVSSAIGLFSLAIIATFYWKKKEPIWHLLGNIYGSGVKDIVAFLSGIWMIGVVASQILGGAHALSIFNFSKLHASILISIAILILSLVKLNKLTKIFSTMLLFSSATLLIILIFQGISWLPHSVGDFFISSRNITAEDIFGTLLTTVLVTFIGMDFHQFLVQSKTEKDAIKGSIFGGIILLVLSTLILTLVYGSVHTSLSHGVTNGAEMIPMILRNFGNRYHPALGIILALPILFVSAGSGGGVTRIISTTMSEFSFTNNIFRNKKLYNISAVLLSFLISMSGKSIIDLIVSFYAIYVGSVFIPFIVHVLAGKFNKRLISGKAMFNAIMGSFIVTSIILVISFLPMIQFPYNTSASIILTGFTSSAIILYLFRIYENLK